MSNIPDKVRTELENLEVGLKAEFEEIKKEAEKDIEIDDLNLDAALLQIPKLQSKWSAKYSDENVILKDLFGFKEQVKFERWKYYSGKQTEKYVAENGIVHDKILKTDVDKYISADEKISLVNKIISIQKEKVDYIERLLKELGSRGFHINGAVSYRKFLSGG